MTRRRWLSIGAAAVVLIVVAVAAVVAVRVLRDDEGTELQQAVAMAPSDARRVLWTDWAGVRDRLGLDLDAESGAAQVQSLLDRGYDADLTSTSALGSSAVAMQEGFGFSPASLEWELFVQSEATASLTMKLGDAVSTDDVAAALRDLGYQEPDEADGVWSTSSTVDPVTADVTPELAFVALDEDAGLVLAGDSKAGAESAREAVDDDAEPPVPDDLVAQAGSPLSAALYSGAEACGALAMANADPDAQAEGETLVAQAGKVNPMTGFAIAAEPDGGVRFVMSFESEEQARTNADTRAVLAAGPAPGQGGQFTDRFSVDQVSAEGELVTIDVTPVEGSYVVSDLSVGALLFATC